MVTPIVNAVNYEYRDFEVLRKITDGEIDGYTYHRDDNPTVRAVEKSLAALKGAEDCIVCTSGMAACTLVYLSYLKTGDHVILFHNIYGAHYKVSLILERCGRGAANWIARRRRPIGPDRGSDHCHGLRLDGRRRSPATFAPDRPRG